MWGSRLKMLRNSSSSSILELFLLQNSFFPPHSPPLKKLTHFLDYFRSPNEMPSIQGDFFGIIIGVCNDHTYIDPIVVFE